MKRRTLLFVAASALAFGAFSSDARAQNPQGGRTGGILTNKSDAWIEVKADGEKKPQRLLPRIIAALPQRGGGLDRAMLAQFQQLVVGNRVDLAWVFDEQLRVIEIAHVLPRARKGEVTGIVDETGRGWIDVLPEGEAEEGEEGEAEAAEAGNEDGEEAAASGPLDRYFPRWIETEEGDGELDPTILKQLAKIKAGDRVKLSWEFDERKRVTKIEKLEDAQPQGDQPQEEE
ncbi:MAG TPA: hypothetical protein VF681_01525 [Abditibacteriaceae bacterium]|jgi:hypothetical protein